MTQGTIKKVVAERGFGFISGEQGDIFFHRSAVVGTTIDTLQEGQTVEYQVDEGSRGKGPRATSVKTA
ncbi:MAG: cold shock domain-containing protein [Planctomycetes bacterium]|nr:cold shock domain-containing protein [Planctomycetota bacterium]